MNENKDKALSEAVVEAVNAWTDRYGHTKVGKVLKFFGFGSK